MPAFLIPFLLNNWKAVAIGLGVVALLVWAGCERSKLLDQGAQQERTKIEDANNAAEKKADAGAKTVDECYAAGGSWDRVRGMCDAAATRR